MTNFKRRLVSTALAVTMAVTLLPLPANAADGTQDISIGWKANQDQTTMEQVTVDLTASLSDASGIDSADVYIELTDDEYNALDKTPFGESSDVKLVDKLPAENTPDDTEEPDAEEPGENQPGEEGSGEEPGDQDQGQGQQPSEPNPDDSQGTETPPESTEGNKEPDSEDAETEGDSSGDSDNTGVPTTPEDSTTPEDPEPSQDPTESPAAEESAVAPVSASAGEDLSILRESPRGVSAASLTRDGDVGGDSRIPAGEPEGTSGHYLLFTLNKEDTQPITATLTFVLPEGMDSLDIDVDEEDISLRNVVYTSGETGSAPSIDLSMPTLTLNSAKPEFSLGAPESTSMEINQNAKTLAVTFPFTATVPEGSASYTFQLTLPKGVQLPEENLTVSEDGLSIQAGEDTKVAEVTGLTGATISDPTFTDQTLTFTLTIGEADADLVEEVLNALSDGDASVTFSNLQVSFNDLFSAGNDTKIQLTVTQKDPEDGETTEPQSASIALTSPEVKPEYTPGNTAPVTQSVTWLDNNNTEGRRPDYQAGEFYPEIHYTIKKDGNEVKTGTLNETTLTELGFEGWPTIEKTNTGFSLDLPETLTVSDPYGNTTTYTIDWTFQAPEVEGYRLDVEDNTWTYTLTEDFTFTLAMKRGYPEGTLSNDQVMALLSQFAFQGQTNVTGGTADSLELPDFDEVDGLTISAGPDDTYTITIPGLAAYGKNNAPLVYWVTEKDSTDKDKVTYEELTECKDTLLPEGDEGDYYKIAYDNAGVADAGSSTSATYSGGKLTLTLTGVTQYQATKIWLDSGGKGARPDAEFRLWRYPAGTDPSQAAQIRWKDVVEGGDNNFIAIDGEDLIPISEETTEPDTGDEGTTDNDTPATLDGETVTDPSEGGDDATPDEEVTEPEITTQSEFRIVFKDNAGNPLDLPKYDPDGKRYTYGVREYLTGGTNHYEQVFGEVDADGNVIEGTDILPYNGARANDTLVYNKGILSNRVTNTATASVTKIWKAAAYQAAFEDVAVEFTLYVRVKPEDADAASDTGWEKYQEDNKDVTCVLHDFSAESMTDSTSQGGLDLYDATGQELEYRWVETAVYQGVEGGKIEGATPVAKADEEAGVTGLTEFTLTQTATDKTSKDVVYQSETKYEGNNRTTVTNSVEDTVDFALAKEWEDVKEDEKFDVTFHIYQTLAGNDFDFTKPYVSVTIPKDEDEAPYLVGEDGKSTPSISPAEGVTITLTSDADDIAQFNTENDPITPKDFEDWDAIVQNLPLYDETGHLYNYFVLEAAPEDDGKVAVSPSYDRGYYPATGDYSCVITNGPGKQVVLMVQKNWIDDGDALHREPVTVGVYYEKDGNLEPLMDGEKAVTHEINNNTGSWTDFIYISSDLLKDKEGNELTAEDLYIVEQTVGDAQVTHGNAEDNIPTVDEWGKGYTGNTESGTSIFQVSTDNHRYQVTYERKMNGDPAVPANVAALYVVTNRRLGTVDMTVNKTWVSGGQDADANEGLQILTDALNAVNNSKENEKDLALAFQLQFASETGWNITTNGGTHGDTVSVGGEAVPILGADRVAPAASIQVILGPDTNKTTFSFCNLPKYDEQGAVVAYTVEEVWVYGSNGNWEVLDEGLDDDSIKDLEGLKDLQTIWSEYRAAITSQNYTVGSHDVNPGGNAPADDITDAVQTILNTNPAGTRRDQDEQHITYTNTRAQTKEVKWYKVWRDNFADQQGNRPDLYLDIYRVVHDKDGKELIELVTENYRWEVVQPGTTQESETKIDGSSADVTTGTNAANDVWSVTLHGVDKYDREGYEIQYFAVERTAVRVSDFDYQAAQYAYSSEGHATDIIGDRDNGAEGVTLDLDGDIPWKNSADKPDNIGPFQGIGTEGKTYPRYALVENGTFINTLANSFPVTGMKRWVDLPSGYLSNDPDLPTVTFEVYRSTDADNIPTDGDPVASLTIESGNWASMAKSGSSYSFRIDYEGANVVSVNDGEVRFVPADGNKDAKKLPLYDGNGNRYYYKATEAMAFVTPDTPEAGEDDTVTQVATGTPAVDQIYEVNQDMAGNFTFVNTYDPDVGGLKVKKILSLPADTTAENGGFPTVRFTLTRTYTLSSGEQSKEETVSTLTWTSEQVQEAFAEAKGDATDSTPVLLENDDLVWTGLPIYAPNGSKYVYSIQENTGNLGGYLTYAAEGDVKVADVSTFTEPMEVPAINDLEPQKVTTTTEDGEATATELDVQATFYNVWEDNQETVTLTGTKAWQDYGDAMDTRPTLPNGEVTSATNDPLGLVVKRTANGSKETLELGEDYTVTYEAGENNTWAFKIEGVGDGELEKYATQGVAWTYTVTETTTDNAKLNGYTATTRSASASAASASEEGVVTLGPLTNSLYTKVDFNKKWVDKSGTPITSDYINFDVEVTFQLQVKAGDGTDWVNADEYFSNNVSKDAAQKIGETVKGGDEDAPYTATKSGTVYTANAWSGSFQNLPKVIQVDGNLVTLTYRVIETEVEYQDQTQAIGELDGDQYTNISDGLVTGAAFTSSGNVTTNTLSAISVKVAKEWVDNKNQYDTRPNSQGGSMTWESWFVLQRKTEDEETWENVKLVNLYGTDRANGEGAASNERWSETISGLPTMDFANPESGTYTYRFQELKPKQVDGKVVGYADTDLNDDLSDYLVGNGETYFEAGNKDSFDYKAEYSTDGGSVENKQTVMVTNRLYTQTDKVIAKKVWYNENGGTTVPEGASVTVNLMQQIGDGEWTVYQTETLNADNNWTFTWKNLPEKQNGENVFYSVEEASHTPEEYIYIHKDMSKDADAVTYTFTNVAPTTFSVTKDWVGMDDPSGEITVGLYRTTEENRVGNADDSLKVPGEGNVTQQTATLNAENEWTAEFTGLPKYNEDGAPYHYYALEMSGREPVAQQGSLNHAGQDYAVDYDHANGLIRNIPTTDLTGTKTWVDNGNAYNTRPKAGDFQLTLWRTTDGEIWAEISDLAAAGITFTWDTGEEGSNTWTYHFDNLPLYTPEGGEYTYRVTEKTPPNGYAEQNDGAGVSEDNADATNGPAFTNTLTGTIEVKGTKTWDDNDNADGTRPNSENFQLTLERTTDEKTWEPVSGATVTWTSTEGTAWSYTFGDLPLYDEAGVRYTYRVTEADQDAYDVYYTNGSSNVVCQENLCNVARGELTVTKTVTGNRGSWSQDFDFSVTFTLPEGFQDANGLPQISFKESDGTMGTLKFEDQSLTYTFELHHGQSITFTDLPGGTSYDVDETNSYGHSQWFTGDVGAIPAGEAVTAAFVNHRSGGSWEPDDPTPEDPDDPTPEDPDDPTPEDPDDPEDPDEPDDPGIDIPEDPTPGVDVPTDPDDPTPEDPDDPDDPEDPGIDIPDDPSPGTDIPDDPTPGTDTPTKPSTPDKDTPNKLPQTGQLWWPVGLLMAAGAALLVAGVLRIRKHHGRDAQK